MEVDRHSKNVTNILKNIQKMLRAVINELELIKKTKYSGWFVLLKKDPEAQSGYKFIGFFNPDVYDFEPPWDVSIPIEVPEDIPEFEGW